MSSSGKNVDETSAIFRSCRITRGSAQTQLDASPQILTRFFNNELPARYVVTKLTDRVFEGTIINTLDSTNGKKPGLGRATLNNPMANVARVIKCLISVRGVKFAFSGGGVIGSREENAPSSHPCPAALYLGSSEAVGSLFNLEVTNGRGTDSMTQT